jgi:MFS family permease
MSIAAGAHAPGRGLSVLWRRQLDRYPDTAHRMTYLGITVLATIILYYENYVLGSVGTKVMADFGMSFTHFVLMLVASNALGAFASLFAGLADRWGRANLVAGGLILTGLITAFVVPNAGNSAAMVVGVCAIGLVEGIALVATPALIRDFSPQVGRASAMGFWTMGPVLGSLVVTMVSSHTLDSHPDWAFQFKVCGYVGLVVAVIALLWLRELSPKLRDQLMVTMRDRALIEARAAGIDPEQLEKGQWRQMLHPQILGSSLAIALFLTLYYVFVVFLVVFFATNFGYTEQRANSLGNWFWAADAIALVVAGVVSDKLGVRKPLMLVGGVVSIVGTILFAIAAHDTATSYHHFAALFVMMAAGTGVAYVAWMASFTETIEKRNPAATATGLAVWGWLLRLVVVAAFVALPLIVPATSTLVDHGAEVSEIAATYPTQVGVLTKVDPATLTALGANPSDQAAGAKAVSELTGLPVTALADPANAAAVQKATEALGSMKDIPAEDIAYLSKYGTDVTKASGDSQDQWRTWWWICVVCQVLFLPCVFLMVGRWSPRKAKQDAAEHEAMVARELAAMHGSAQA